MNTCATAASPNGNRREPRKTANWPALIRLPDGQEIGCIVRDVSKTGAKLTLPFGSSLAKQFLVKVEERGFAFAVSLRWRRGAQVGVQFEKIVRLKAMIGDVEAGDAAHPLGAFAP